MQIDLNTMRFAYLAIPEDNLRYPFGMEYKADTKRVYWADRDGAEIGSSNLDGTNIRIVSLPKGTF